MSRFKLDYLLPKHSADGNFVIRESGNAMLLVDPNGLLTRDQQQKFAEIVVEILNGVTLGGGP